MQSKLKVVSVNDKPFSSMAQLFVPLEENPLVLPLPKTLPDPVGNDIKEIPQALKNIQTDWRMGEGQNRASAMPLVLILAILSLGQRSVVSNTQLNRDGHG